MSEVTQILAQLEAGDPSSAAELLPLVYGELRKLAAARLAHERPGQTLDATALVHEAYMRLVGADPRQQRWQNRGHFFAAAAEAIRRILVENARKKGRWKRGAGRIRHDIQELEIVAPGGRADILAIDEALEKLEAANDMAARLVKLRYFAGLSIKQSAGLLGISSRKADQIWAYARAFLLAEIEEDGPE
jgi:RNA polymerase sigma factor (TIGR02999 family)